MGSGVAGTWVPRGRLAPVNELPGAEPVGLLHLPPAGLTCHLLPLLRTSLQTLLFTSCGRNSLLCVLFPLASLYPLIPGEACVTCPFRSLPSQDKHAEEVRKNKELKEEASR